MSRPTGDVVVTRVPEGIRIDHADAQALFSRAVLVGPHAPGVLMSSTDLDSPDLWVTIAGTNRTVTYRLTDYNIWSDTYVGTLES